MEAMERLASSIEQLSYTDADRCNRKQRKNKFENISPVTGNEDRIDIKMECVFMIQHAGSVCEWCVCRSALLDSWR